MKVLMIVKSNHLSAEQSGRKTAEYLLAKGAQCYVQKKQLSMFEGLPVEEWKAGDWDLLIAVGGDGTILKAAQLALNENKPVLGINVGRLGFIAGAEPKDIQQLDRLFTGDYHISRRLLLQAEYSGKKHTVLNDLVIARESVNRLIETDVYQKGHKVITYRADSVLFSTPTGSTAYAMSNGGPIADPELSYIAMSSICPHSFINRTILFREDAELTIYLRNLSFRPAQLVADGDVVASIRDDEQPITIRKSDRMLHMIVLNNRQFYQIIEDKFSIYP